jgi:adenine-specific DNA-methyltransferase
MAAIDDLIKQIEDKALRDRLTQELDRISENRKFGLVFEEHLPECTPIYGAHIKKGSLVSRRDNKIKDIYYVLDVNDGLAICVNRINGEKVDIHIDKLVVVAQFGEPIFPTLIPIDKVKNADNDLSWHTLIEADNYHALQLLEYIYPKQVDCIYIDPPYNTGAHDWKYNNDYVDSADRWRHSKWLSMMQRRLKIARRILNPETGVLIVTIDEHELHHLRVLLQQIFPEAYIQIVTIVINPKGVTQGRFSRVEEYAVYCFMPNAYVHGGDDPLLGEKPTSNKPRWKGLLRSGTNARREDSKNQFYPVLVDPTNKRIIRAGETLPYGEAPDLDLKIDGYSVAWPIRTDLSEGNWGVSKTTLNNLISKGYVALGKYDEKRKTWGISYLSKKPQQQIETGELKIIGHDEQRNVVDVEYASAQERQIKTVWHRNTHDAGAYGSDLVSKIIGQSRAFTFPKALYAVRDSISAVVKNNPNALIVDFFAGSGTTLHAVNLLNEEDNGQRRCIMVTNNEVSEDVAKELKQQGFQTGDPEWEKQGICQSVTWPRTKFSIKGKRDNGTVIEGDYLTNKKTKKEISRSFFQISFTASENLNSTKNKKQLVSLLGKEKLPQSLVKADSKFILSDKYPASILFDESVYEEWLEALEDQNHISEFYIVTNSNALFNKVKEKVEQSLGNITVLKNVKKPMSEGFKANVEYFKLGFLDKNSIELGQQFREILPILWLKSGAIGERPELASDVELPEMLISSSSNFAILIDETYFAEFVKQLSGNKNITHVFIVTNSEEAFREMASQIDIENITQLYRDYIDNFVINSRRG